MIWKLDPEPLDLDRNQVAMASREYFYECVYEREGNEYRFHVRAWSAAEAAALFRSMLLEDGARERGNLRVLDLRGKTVLQSEYAPAARLP